MTPNNKISKKGTFGTTMGVTSVIAILVILVLIVFAALSIVTAKADLNLSEKTAEATTAFYKADSQAEEKVAEIAAAVDGTDSVGDWEQQLADKGYKVTAPSDVGSEEQGEATSASGASSASRASEASDTTGGAAAVNDTIGNLVEFTVPIDDSKELFVRLAVVKAAAETDPTKWEIKREVWQVRSTTKWENNNDVQLIIE